MANWTQIDIIITFDNIFELKHYREHHFTKDECYEYNIQTHYTNIQDTILILSGEGRWEADKSNLLSDLQGFNTSYIHIAESEPGNDFFYEYEEKDNEIICEYVTEYFSPEAINYYGIDEFEYLFEGCQAVDDIPKDLLTILNKADIDPEDVLWYNESNETKETT